MKTVILTIDGGGVKGIIPAFILNYLETRLKKQCYEIFDIIGGTSTGGIISSALTSPSLKNPSKPFTAYEIFNIYSEDGNKIFVKQGDGIINAEYYADDDKGRGVEKYLQSIFGNRTLVDNYKFIRNLSGKTLHTFNTSYIVNSTGTKIDNPLLGVDYGPFLFNWFDANKTPDELNYYVWESARATSAAPTYFPIAHVGGNSNGRSSTDEKWVLDGGIMSNNPAIWAISEAFRIGMAKNLSDIILISIGTGDYVADNGLGITNEGPLVPEKGNWGSMQWLGRNLYNLSEKEFNKGVIMDMILDASQLISNLQLQSFVNAGLTYFRLQPEITLEQSQMDNISPNNINSLKITAQAFVRSNKEIFDKIIQILS